MPKQYEAIRDKMMSEGMSEDMAQSHAAAIYNSKHPGAPVTGKSEGKSSKKGLQALVNKSMKKGGKK